MSVEPVNLPCIGLKTLESMTSTQNSCIKESCVTLDHLPPIVSPIPTGSESSITSDLLPPSGSENQDIVQPKITPEIFFKLIQEGNSINDDVKKSIRLFGRIERCVISENGLKEVPLQLTYRPHRRSNVMAPPCSFVASSDALSSFVDCSSLQSVLETISLEPDVIASRLTAIKEGRLDHLIILFSPNDIPVVVANLDGIHQLLSILHPPAAERYEKVLHIFKTYYVGESNFQKRLDMFSSDDWKLAKQLRDCMWLPSGIHLNYPECGCQYYDFDSYCTAFDKVYLEECSETGEDKIPNIDAVLETRRMMHIMFDCNKFYGMDGYIYHANGNRMDEEYLALNRPLDSKKNDGENAFYCRFLSEVPRFGRF